MHGDTTPYRKVLIFMMERVGISVQNSTNIWNIFQSPRVHHSVNDKEMQISPHWHAYDPKSRGKWIRENFSVIVSYITMSPKIEQNNLES